MKPRSKTTIARTKKKSYICPVCKKKTEKFLGCVGTYDMVLCSGCQLRYSDPMLHPGEEWYEESEIYKQVERNIPSFSQLKTRWEFKVGLKLINPSTGPLLDVGCGRGDYLRLAQKAGFRVAGIDINKHLVKIAREKFNIERTYPVTLDDFYKESAKNSYGSVTAFEVLEHMPNPHEFLCKIFDLIKTGGTCVVSVPGYTRWPHWVDSEVDLPPHHLSLWSEKSMSHLFIGAGFKNVKMWRKPFLLNDLSYHAVRRFPALLKSGLLWKFFRYLLKIGFLPIWAIIRIIPGSGGFTLLVKGEK